MVFLGLGTGLIHLTGFLVIPLYFDKYRPIAFGISTAGNDLHDLRFYSPFNDITFKVLGFKRPYFLNLQKVTKGHMVPSVSRPYNKELQYQSWW